ncbi:MAG: UbiA prenyltransferase family protein [Candidatus Heimdallarchaeota archaeon]
MKKKIRNILRLLRIRQYYKNIMIFVGTFFSFRLFEIELYPLLLIGFILLCCASSFNYIINDIKDIEKDKLHTEKLSKKPLASGEVSKTFAIILSIILVLIIIVCVLFIGDIGFIFMIILIIVTGQLYNHVLKNYAFIDIIVLSMGYLWRALAGCIIIKEFVSAWLFLAIFEVALFLSIAKRKGDLIYLGEEVATQHKKVYDQYSLKLLEQFHVIIAGSLFMTYSLYLIQKFEFDIPGNTEIHHWFSILTIPISLYILMRYMYLTSSKPKIARSTERAFLDKGILIAGFLLLAILFFSFYFNYLF